MRYFCMTMVGLFCLMAAGCAGHGRLDAEAGLEKHYALWQSRDTEHYQFTYVKAYGLARTFTVVVDNDDIVSVYDNNLQQFIAEPEQAEAKTIEDFFELIRTAIKNDAGSLQIDYDREYGYPREIAIDYNMSIADDEVYYSVVQFNP